jgi:hypothetical protein
LFGLFPPTTSTTQSARYFGVTSSTDGIVESRWVGGEQPRLRTTDRTATEPRLGALPLLDCQKNCDWIETNEMIGKNWMRIFLVSIAFQWKLIIAGLS